LSGPAVEAVLQGHHARAAIGAADGPRRDGRALVALQLAVDLAPTVTTSLSVGTSRLRSLVLMLCSFQPNMQQRYYNASQFAFNLIDALFSYHFTI
jgi:hypothetical protein